MAENNQSISKKRKLAADETVQVKETVTYRGNGESSETVETKIKSSNSKTWNWKMVNDPIHGHVFLHPLCVKIMDTTQFQRLRNIKQLSACYYVFPGASHNRFEHCLGVCYLAGKLCRQIQKHQPELNITDEDLLCVQIAGLCHDLGHGPFSHLFDGRFIPTVEPNSKWRHEDGSKDMFDYLLKVNNLHKEFSKWNLNEIDLIFIKELIVGPLDSETLAWPYKGRPEAKSFLYEIVANKITGVDVDKWDYFARDCYFLGISNMFDYKRYMKFSRVINVDGKLQICTRDKEAGTLYDMFHTRNSLHRRAYQHKTANIIDIMISEALVEANDYLLIPGTDNNLLKMSESIYDMQAYSKLNDSVLDLIMMSNDGNLQKAKEIIQRIHSRNLYKIVGQAILNTPVDKANQCLIKDQIIGCSTLTCLDEKDFVSQVVVFDYGMADRNPVEKVRFYAKDQPDVAVHLRKNQVSQMLPESFAEQHVRFYCKKSNEALIAEAKLAFSRWCAKVGADLSQPDVQQPELTPDKRKHK